MAVDVISCVGPSYQVLLVLMAKKSDWRNIVSAAAHRQFLALVMSYRSTLECIAVSFLPCEIFAQNRHSGSAA